jgi:hypothetical protein
LWVIGGNTFSSWFGTFLRHFATKQPDSSRLYPVATTVPSDEGLAAQWAAGAPPASILITIISSPEYMQIARNRDFWTGARSMS